MNKKMNVYYYGEDRSHCSSCWERGDEDVKVLLTTLTLEEMIEQLYSYCSFWVDEKFSYSEFLERVASNGDDGSDNILYPTILFEISGTSYCPEFHYTSSAVGESYNVSEVLNPAKIISGWEDLKVKWSNYSIEKKKKEEKRLEDIKKEEEKKKKIEKDQKDFDDFTELSKIWDGEESPYNYVPTKKDLKNLDKFLEKFKVKKDQFDKYVLLKKVWDGKSRPKDYYKELTVFEKILKDIKEGKKIKGDSDGK